eukprot:13438884-Ditylum_brightwellii.AAC.1
MAHTSLQNVSQVPNTISTNEYVPIHRWNISTPVPATNSICNLLDGIDFNESFLPNSTSDNSTKDAYSYHNNYLP